MEEELEELCNRFRDKVKKLSFEVKGLMEHGDFKNDETYKGQQGEMRANIMLTYRHLEIARMRIGKILQAADNGVPILDK